MTKLIQNSIDFFRVWILDVILYPIRLLTNLKLKKKKPSRIRVPIKSNTIYVCIHEWGGYPIVRTKKIKNIQQFKCGLKYQIERFAEYRTQKKVHLTVTLSEPTKHERLDWIKNNCDKLMFVPNLGMDFSGYSNFFDSIKNLTNSYVILTNSSINYIQEDFLDSYIKYMDENNDVGILGISACSKYYHTLIRNNYNPHIQSFFLLTTISVLNEIFSSNNNSFPGKNTRNKHMLIRNGEVGISRLALKLGYNLAIVQDNKATKFNYNHYPLPKGDLRKFATNPNSITTILP